MKSHHSEIEERASLVINVILYLRQMTNLNTISLVCSIMLFKKNLIMKMVKSTLTNVGTVELYSIRMKPLMIINQIVYDVKNVKYVFITNSSGTIMKTVKDST